MKTMNHTQYQAQLKNKTDKALAYTIKDARQAIDALPDSENASYYADEICYASTEQYRRRQLKKTEVDTNRHIGQLLVAAVAKRAKDTNVRDAVDSVLGAGTYDKIAEQLYNELRAQA